MTEAELGLLAWLAQEDANQYGECHGNTLDRLMTAGLVDWKGRDVRGEMFSLVGLTEAGKDALQTARERCPHPYSSADGYGGRRCGVCLIYQAQPPSQSEDR